jgi:hypothetical protein
MTAANTGVQMKEDVRGFSKGSEFSINFKIRKNMGFLVLLSSGLAQRSVWRSLIRLSHLLIM